jgi:programmed cell death 8 (apoptosis-inducing factor)
MLPQLSIDQKDVVIVGGGFLGTELACAMNKRSKEAGLNVTPRPGKKQRQITHIMPEPGVLYRCLPRYLSDNTAMQMSQAGVDMRTNTVVTGLSRDPSTGVLVVELTVRTLGHLRRGPGSATARWFDTRKYTLKTDHVIFCTGIKPEV